MHYLPVDEGFETLEAIYDWAEDHPDDVATMRSNQHAYAEHVLSAAAVRSYAGAVLRHLASALTYDVALGPDDVAAEGFVAARRKIVEAVVAEHTRRDGIQI